jgi:peptidoglycan/LPS O-acetylase OafA/YrhL
MKTFGEVFDPRHNSLNALRLLLAGTVIVSHAWLVGGFGLPPSLGGTDIGLVAISGFFAISGYLVTSSRMRSHSLARYLWKRFLRIYPAFLVVLVVVAVGFAPLSTLLDPASHVEWGSAGLYVVKNATLSIQQLGIDGTLVDSRYPFVWNLPLWSLFYEALCYLLIGALVSLVPRRALTATLVVLLALFAVLAIAARFQDEPVIPVFVDNLASLGSFFVAGALLYLHRDRIPAGWSLALIALAASVLFAALGLFKPLGAVPFCYLLLFLGSVLPLQRFGARNDISYGMYVYGFPVQQCLMIVLVNVDVPVWLIAALSLAATIPFAWASWLLVERPALRLKYAGSQVHPSTSSGSEMPVP